MTCHCRMRSCNDIIAGFLRGTDPARCPSKDPNPSTVILRSRRMSFEGTAHIEPFCFRMAHFLRAIKPAMTCHCRIRSCNDVIAAAMTCHCRMASCNDLQRCNDASLQDRRCSCKHRHCRKSLQRHCSCNDLQSCNDASLQDLRACNDASLQLQRRHCRLQRVIAACNDLQ